jgi:hypothetical protein
VALINRRLDQVFRKKVQGLIVGLAKRHRVTAVLLAEDFCPNCDWDPVHRGGAGRYKAGGPKPFSGRMCPVCQNVGKVKTPRQRHLRANVRIGSAAQQQPDRALSAGLIPDRHALIKVRAQDERTLMAADHFIIDGIRYKPVSETAGPGRRGLLTHATSELLVKEDA